MDRDAIQAQLDAFDDDLDLIEDETGVEFSDEQRREIFDNSRRNGWNADATAQAAADVLATTFGVTAEQLADNADQAQAPGDPAAPDEGAQRLERDLTADLERVEQGLGRPLLRTERDAIVDRTLEYVQRHNDMPEGFALDALTEHHGGNVPITETETGRNWFATQRLHEAQNPRLEDDDTLDNLDPDDRDDRVRFQIARLQGVEFEEAVDGEPAELAEAA